MTTGEWRTRDEGGAHFKKDCPEMSRLERLSQHSHADSLGSCPLTEPLQSSSL